MKTVLSPQLSTKPRLVVGSEVHEVKPDQEKMFSVLSFSTVYLQDRATRYAVPVVRGGTARYACEVDIDQSSSGRLLVLALRINQAPVCMDLYGSIKLRIACEVHNWGQ